MKSPKRGKNISKSSISKTNLDAQVTQITPFGVWVLMGDHEFYLNYKDYPWFKEAKVSQIHHLEVTRTGNLRWPELDIDLEYDSLIFPEAYPLVYKD